MRRFHLAALLALSLALIGAASAASRAHHRSARNHRTRPALVSMTVELGYGGQYRTTAWAPVRVTVHNRTSSLLQGTVEIPDKSTVQNGPPTLYHTLYAAPLVLPGGATKGVTLYMPGYDAQSFTGASFRAGSRTLATADSTDYPSQFQTSEITVGALTGDPQSARWLAAYPFGPASVNLTDLTPATLDPLPDALATFDIIALTNTDSSRLRDDQLHALEDYVRAGGTLLLVGGPDWQETLRPVPAALVPGSLNGSMTVPGLGGLAALTGSAPPGKATTISVLTHPRGAVLAAQNGVPLAVQESMGEGQILYLAFDPQVTPVAQWKREPRLVSTLINAAAARAVGRADLPGGYQPGGPYPYCCGPVDISTELSNVPAAALPSLILFIALTALYVLLLGPVNFLALRRLRRRELAWVTVPALAALCMGATFGVALHLKGNTVLINSIGTIDLEGDGGTYPATIYAGLFAPLRGDYHLTYDGRALPAAIAQPYFYSGPGPQPINNPLTLTFQEGAQTRVNFLSMNMWSMREVMLRTTTQVSGALKADLTLDGAGRLVGTIHNATNLDLLHPAVMAGRAVVHLPDLPSGATVRLTLKPGTSTFDRRPIWLRLYGQPGPQQYYGGPYYGTGVSVPFLGGFGGGFCCGPVAPKERNLNDRIRNVASALPETQMAAVPAEISLFAWTERSLGSISVDGISPQRRDLTLVMAPLSAHLPAGSFTLPTGVLGARVTQVTAGDSTGGGCCPFDPRVQPIYVGPGGSVTFEFDIPAEHVHFRRLKLDVNAGGADSGDLGHVYNWQSRRWETVDLTFGEVSLHHPDQYLSPSGGLLLKLTPTLDSGAVAIGDVDQQLQLSGSGTVG